jgi:hypothetical protein
MQNMLTDEQLDRVIRDAIKDMTNPADSDDVPDLDLEEVWGRLQKKLRLRRIKGLAFNSLVVAVLLLCFGALATVASGPIKAIEDRWSHPLLLSACFARYFYPVFTPSYLPAGYMMSAMNYYPVDQNNASLEIQYAFRDGKHNLIIAQGYAAKDEISYGFNTQNAIVSDIIIRGYPGKQVYFPEKDYTQWFWADGNFTYQIGGEVSPDEMQRIVSSMAEIYTLQEFK